MDPDRWEQGSEYHWVPPAELGGSAGILPDAGRALLVSSGRDALRLVLREGVERHGWRRLWVPDYFCQHVTAALRRPDMELRPYPDDPIRATPDLPDAKPGDAVFVVNYFGLRAPVTLPRLAGVAYIEDHSHDLDSDWERESQADYCVASLRKTLPVSDGGMLWSPAGHPLPAQPELTEQRRRAAAAKLAGMILKAMYLGGASVDRAEYRELLRRGERALAVPAVSAMSEVSRALVGGFPLAEWRAARRRNYEVLRDGLADVDSLQVLAPAPRGVSFSVVAILDSAARRERVRLGLIERNVFPAILWPLERTHLRVRPETRDLSRRMLSIHCDGRYTVRDMERVAGLVCDVARG